MAVVHQLVRLMTVTCHTNLMVLEAPVTITCIWQLVAVVDQPV